MYGKHTCPNCKQQHEGKRAKCNPCHAATSREWRAKNPEKYLATVKRYQERYPERTKLNNRIQSLKKNYGISIDDYNLLLVRQNYRCAICESLDCGGPGKVFHVDHDHATGKVRGLLCCYCNFVIGHSKDSPENLRKAATYLEREVPFVW